MKTFYIIELVNGKFAEVVFEGGTHVLIQGLNDFEMATIYNDRSEVEKIFADYKKFKEHGFGFEPHNSEYQYHGLSGNREIDLKRIRTIQINLVDEELNEELNEDQKNVIHDCYFDIKGSVPTKSTIAKVVEQLPKDISLLAKIWGWSDTEVRDSVFKFIRDRFIE